MKEVLGRSGQLGMEYAALCDIEAGEELVLDYRSVWDTAWAEFAALHPYQHAVYFRRESGVPGFYPSAWLDCKE